MKKKAVLFLIQFLSGLNKRSKKGIIGSLLFAAVLLQINCKKSTPLETLPPITQEGKNTFGCKIDNEIWLPNNKCDFFTSPCSAIQVTVLRPNNTAQLPVGINFSMGRKINSESSYFQFSTKFVGNTTNNYISKPGNIFDSLEIQYITGNILIYQSSSLKPGVVEIIKLDTEHQIIAGTFAFTLFSSRGDSIVVKDGRFDLKFNVCKCFN